LGVLGYEMMEEIFPLKTSLKSRCFSSSERLSAQSHAVLYFGASVDSYAIASAKNVPPYNSFPLLFLDKN
jgi:hypothetical protein